MKQPTKLISFEIINYNLKVDDDVDHNMQKSPLHTERYAIIRTYMGYKLHIQKISGI